MDFFFLKKRRIVCAAFLSKGGHWKKRRLRRASFKKILLGQSLVVLGVQGRSPRKKIGAYDIKVLAFSFHFPVDKFAAQLTSLLRPEQLRRLYSIQKTAIHEARPYLEAQRSSKAGALCR